MAGGALGAVLLILGKQPTLLRNPLTPGPLGLCTPPLGWPWWGELQVWGGWRLKSASGLQGPPSHKGPGHLVCHAYTHRQPHHRMETRVTVAGVSPLRLGQL